MTRARVSVGLTEAQWQNQVIALAREGGWMVTHFRPAVDRSGRWSTPLQGDRGWPDLILAHPPRRQFIVAELKRDGGRLTVEQARWITALDRAGVDVRVWTPADRLEVERTLLPPAWQIVR